MKKTNRFFASFVFSDEAKTVLATIYKKPIISEESVEVFPNRISGNYILVKNCNFYVFLSQNEGIMPSKIDNTYIVDNENAKYKVVAYLGSKNGNVLSNSIELITELPKGLTMNYLEGFTDGEVFVFSGLNLMLFDVVPQGIT